MPLSNSHSESAGAVRNVMFRFISLLLSCVLLALNMGRSLSHEVANLCQLFGLCGMAFYFCLELVADQRARNELKAKTNIRAGDQRLANRLQTEQAMAVLVASERHHR